MITNIGYHGHPEGTWAGQLFLDGAGRNAARRAARESRRERIEREEEAFTDREARRAHTAYTLGDRSLWACTGHRVYDRRQKRARRAGAAQRAAATA